MPAYYLEAYVVVLGLVLLMAEAFGPSSRKSYLGAFAVLGLIGALFMLGFAEAPSADNREMQRFYEFDAHAKFYKGFALVCALFVTILAVDFRRILSDFTEDPGSEDGTGEYYCLPLFACAGMMWMASAVDLVSLFVALELVTITFYVLVAYMRRNVGSLEAGVKYLILGALSTGFLVYGIAWIYGTTGTTNLAEIAQVLEANDGLATTPLFFGLALIILALAFKVGAVPMQIWIPDVYQGAPTPTTAFLSIGSKAAGFAVLIRTLEPFLEAPVTAKQTTVVLFILSALTILAGNLAAIAQSNFKRLLGYSSIAHAGFILLAVTAWTQGSDTTQSSKEVVGFYLTTYLIMTLGVFFVLSAIRKATGSEEISAFEGLGRRNPFLALCTAILVSALAGLPLTAGFLGKFLVFQTAIGHPDPELQKLLWGAIGVGFIGVAAGFYYYLKVIRSMYWVAPQDEHPLRLSAASGLLIPVFALATIILGIYPQPILWLVGS